MLGSRKWAHPRVLAQVARHVPAVLEDAGRLAQRHQDEHRHAAAPQQLRSKENNVFLSGAAQVTGQAPEHTNQMSMTRRRTAAAAQLTPNCVLHGELSCHAG